MRETKAYPPETEAGAGPDTRDTPTPMSSPSSGGSSTSSGGMGFIMGSITSAIELVRNPVAFITANKDKPATTREIMINYVAVLAAIPFFATLIGDLWYYSLFVSLRFAGSFFAYAFTAAVLTYIFDVVAVYVIAVVIRMLAPTFGSTATEIQSLKLAAYIYTPVFLIAILNLIPLLSIITILGILYGLYILYMGLPIVIGTPKDKVIGYVIGVVIATFIIYFVIGFIISIVSAAFFFTSLGLFY